MKSIFASSSCTKKLKTRGKHCLRNSSIDLLDQFSFLFSRVRIWDIVILVPNLLFLLFITVRFNRARLKLRATSSPIFLAFYVLVICNVVISVIRCIVSMTVNAATTVGGIADKILWVTVRFFLLSTEMSVVIFGLAFGEFISFLLFKSAS